MSPLLVPGGRIACTHDMRFTRGAPSLALPLALCCAMCALALAPLTVDAARPMSGRHLSQSDDEAMMAYATNAWGLPVNTWKAANSKSSSHVLPRMQEHHTSLHRTTHGWIEGYVPKEYAPLTVSLIVYLFIFSLLFFVFSVITVWAIGLTRVFFYSQAAIVSYVLLVLPFCAAYVVFKAMDALLSIQKLLMAINVYNACYCALLVVINLWTGNEPMASLQESNEADYLILQFFKWYVYFHSHHTGSWTDGMFCL